MGACLSCLGLRNDNGNDIDQAERQRLLYQDDHAASSHQYGSWSQQANLIPPQNLMSAEEIAREQNALNNITRWASDQIVEIFPHRTNLAASAHAHGAGTAGLGPVNGNNGAGSGGLGDVPSVVVNGTGEGSGHGPEASAHQDVLLSMIPGDKSKRSIRIYPASRPGSSLSREEGTGTASRGGLDQDGGVHNRPSVLVKLNVDFH